MALSLGEPLVRTVVGGHEIVDKAVKAAGTYIGNPMIPVPAGKRTSNVCSKAASGVHRGTAEAVAGVSSRPAKQTERQADKKRTQRWGNNFALSWIQANAKGEKDQCGA